MRDAIFQVGAQHGDPDGRVVNEGDVGAEIEPVDDLPPWSPLRHCGRTHGGSQHRLPARRSIRQRRQWHGQCIWSETTPRSRPLVRPLDRNQVRAVRAFVDRRCHRSPDMVSRKVMGLEFEPKRLPDVRAQPGRPSVTERRCPAPPRDRAGRPGPSPWPRACRLRPGCCTRARRRRSAQCPADVGHYATRDREGRRPGRRRG